MLLSFTFIRVVIVFIFLAAVRVHAEWTGEFYFSGQWGGTDFTEQDADFYQHKRSWNFSYGNSGYSLGLKGGAKVGGVLGIGLGAEYGWKEEGTERNTPSTGHQTSYGTQMTRLLAGGHITLSPVKDAPVHFYSEYYPLVMSTVVYTKDDAANPFRKEDTLKGIGYGFGLGVLKDSVMMRFIGRRIIYGSAKLQGSEYTLPDSTFSKMTTDEFVFQLGTVFE